MNEQPKSKVLIIIIGILLLANIVLLSFFLINGKQEQKRDSHAHRGFINDYLQKEVGFDKAQMEQYDSLAKRHHEQRSARYNSTAAQKKVLFTSLADANFSDSAIRILATSLHDQQAVMETAMLLQLKEIRGICTEQQRKRFDTGFYKIFIRRGESRKEK